MDKSREKRLSLGREKFLPGQGKISLCPDKNESGVWESFCETFAPMSICAVNVNLFRNSKPVGVYPSTIALGVGSFAHKSHLGSNPFALP